jgi:carbon-monoxide dehydrogenase medium subunit
VRLVALAEEEFFHKNISVLSDTAKLMGGPQVRNLATVGGNICNAAPSADLCPPLIALGAEITLSSQQRTKIVPLEEFFKGPGKTIISNGELLSEIKIPVPPEGSGASYQRICTRSALDIAVAGVASYLELEENGVVKKARIALGAVAPTPVRVSEAETILQGHPISERILEDVIDAALKVVQPIDDVRGSAKYRKEMVRVLVGNTINEAYSRSQSNS